MRIRALTIALVLAHSSPALSMDDTAAIADALDAYKKALIASDGESASQLTSAGSHTLLRNGVVHALSLEANELRALSPIHQLSALLLRHSLATEHLRKMSATDPIAYVVNAQVFDVLAIANAEVDEIHVEGEEAEAYLRNSPIFHPHATIALKKERGSWRVDLPAFLEQFVPVGVIYVSTAVGETTDIQSKIMSSTIAWITGRAPDANIWNPPG